MDHKGKGTPSNIQAGWGDRLLIRREDAGSGDGLGKGRMLER